MPATELFLGFLSISIRAFGGVLPWARQVLVEEKKWLNEREFTDTLSLCQFLPGPNIVNLSIVVGKRELGWRGAVAASLGLTAVPMLIIVGLGALYDRLGEWGTLGQLLDGTAAAAAGLIFAMAMKMAVPRFRARPLSPAITGAIFLGVGVLAYPMWWVLAALTPVSLFLAWRGRL
jgi:chromate transporter